MTGIDFDGCGPGSRAHDPAVIRWCARLRDLEAVWWEPYLPGCLTQRPFSGLAIAAMPAFACACCIQHIGLHAGDAYDWGYLCCGDSYFDQRLDCLL